MYLDVHNFYIFINVLIFYLLKLKCLTEIYQKHCRNYSFVYQLLFLDKVHYTELRKQ
jgi:hypothetical protein